jgi:hypothetical protein
MPVILSPDLRAFLYAEPGDVALFLSSPDDKLTSLVLKTNTNNIDTLRGDVPIHYCWTLWDTPWARVLRMEMTIYDRPHAPYVLETFMNVADPAQLADLRQLTVQEYFQIHVFDRRCRYKLTKRLAQDAETRWSLVQAIDLALLTLKGLDGCWDFDRAKVNVLRLVKWK